jgi:hypothetical protein
MSEDRGVIGLYVSVLFVAFVMVAGLIVDGGAIRSGRREAADVAARAARAGAQQIDVDPLMANGVVILDSESARDAANSLVLGSGMAGQVSATPDRVTVSVEVEVPMRLLTLVGVKDKSVGATRSARPAEGVVDG